MRFSADRAERCRTRGDAALPSSAERRLVSVLFVDLVGFTTASEGRDAEDTRELLTRYFDVARQIIERYGGTLEKFIGDAVMAVWGAPVANEDDAERAVRAALDLVSAVPAIDPDLTARAGVLTGEAAVTVGAQGQGMVAGDLVNTASRIQSAADAGNGARRRVDPARLRGRDRLRRRGQARAQGQGTARVAVAGLAGLGPATRRGPRDGRAGGAVRRPRSGVTAGQGALPRERRREASEARVRGRRRRDRQVAALVGVREVHRRPRRRDLVAPRPLPLLRRRRRLLGAGGDDSRPSEDRRERVGRERNGQAPRDARGPSLRPGGAGMDRASPAPPARSRRAERARSRGSLRRLAAVLRAARRAGAARARARGHPLGGRGPRRLRRVPPRLGSAPPDLRPDARSSGDRRSAPGLPGGDPERDDAPAGAARRRRG